MAIAPMAILIIGEEIVSLPCPLAIMRLVMKNSKFKIENIKMVTRLKITIFLGMLLISGTNSAQKNLSLAQKTTQNTENQILVGANQLGLYLPFLKGKNVAVVTNPTGVLLKNNQPQAHLVDTLLSLGVKISKVFAPEHGFRGQADAGAVVYDEKDAHTGLPIISLYGKNKKPTQAQLAHIDVCLFDIQDVGARFYTYLSTLHYVMEACAEKGIPLYVLDRPNPNGHYVDGPVLQPAFTSFVGMHPVPVVYGMTIGEYAQMINGEKWLKNGIRCALHVVPLKGYTHQSRYSLPVKPSPNLPNDKAVNLYPSLCFFEGTSVSVGRGTAKPFQMYGSPYLLKTDFSFTPEPNTADSRPLYKGKKCYGEDLSASPFVSEIHLEWLLKAHRESSMVKIPFFNPMLEKLAGTSTLRKQIIQGESPEQIRQSWQKDIQKFLKIRQKYLLYP